MIARLLRALLGSSRQVPPTYQKCIADQADTISHAATLLGEVRDQLDRIDTLREVNIDGYEIEALKNLVDDHEELESRIEAVLTMPSAWQDKTLLNRAEVHALLRGKKRVPDTVEGLDA